MKKTYVLSFFLFAAFALTAQTRYLNEVFTGVTAALTPYGQNSTVLAYPTIIKQPLVMDLYQPVGDTETGRPLVIYMHTGNFLPFKSPIDGTLGFNGSCGGTFRDSSAIEICTRLAKMGYVSASMDYRAGWNPLASTDVVRRYGIINAAYRGIQDVRTCVRYFKKTVAAGNPYKIDSTKIVVWGQGTGGYISLNANFLDNYLKIPTATNGKFIWDNPSIPGVDATPMVIPQVNGDIYGTSFGLAPNASGGIDTLCYPQHLGYTSDFALAVNMGGACADSAWIDPGHKPLISFHVPYEKYAPYDEGIVTVPTPPGQPVLTVVEVQGSYNVQRLHNSFGNNGSFVGKPGWFDLADAQANAFAKTPKANGKDWSAPTPGLYPFNRPLIDDNGTKIADNTAPWEWSGVVPNNPTCNQNKASAIAVIDTMVRFYAPRACYALGLQDCINKLVSQDEPIASNVEVSAMPNPATDEIKLESADHSPILSIEVYDMNGRLVRGTQKVEASQYVLRRDRLAPGSYVVKLRFENGVMGKKVVFE